MTVSLRSNSWHPQVCIPAVKTSLNLDSCEAVSRVLYQNISRLLSSGNIIVSGSTDRTLKVWNADTGSCIHTLYGHTSTVRCMHLHGSRSVWVHFTSTGYMAPSATLYLSRFLYTSRYINLVFHKYFKPCYALANGLIDT